MNRHTGMSSFSPGLDPVPAVPLPPVPVVAPERSKGEVETPGHVGSQGQHYAGLSSEQFHQLHGEGKDEDALPVHPPVCALPETTVVLEGCPVAPRNHTEKGISKGSRLRQGAKQQKQ